MTTKKFNKIDYNKIDYDLLKTLVEAREKENKDYWAYLAGYMSSIATEFEDRSTRKQEVDEAEETSKLAFIIHMYLEYEV